MDPFKVARFTELSGLIEASVDLSRAVQLGGEETTMSMSPRGSTSRYRHTSGAPRLWAAGARGSIGIDVLLFSRPKSSTPDGRPPPPQRRFVLPSEIKGRRFSHDWDR